MNRTLLIGALLALTFFASPSAQGQEQTEDSTPAPVRSDRPKKDRSPLPEDVHGLETVSQSSYDNGDYIRFLQANMKLRKLRPYTPEYMYNMVVALSLLKKPRAAYDIMLRMQQQGLSYDFNATDDTENIRGTQVYDYVNDLLIRAGEPMGEAEIAFEIPGEKMPPAAIEWDGTREKFLIGSSVSGALTAISTEGRAEILLSPDAERRPWAVRGLLVDEAAGRLWISSSTMSADAGHAAENANRAALFEFDLASLQQLNRFDVPDDGKPHDPGALAISPSGDLYVIDHAAALVLRKSRDGASLTPFVRHPDMHALSDIVITHSGHRMYISDREAGILVVDPVNQTSAMLSGPETLNLGGISGLFLWGDKLGIIQSDISPQRLMRLEIDPSGGMVTAVSPMSIAQQTYDRPGRGTIVGEEVYYLASGAERQAGQDGEPFLVMRTPLDSGQEIIPPDMRKFEEETLSKARGN
jgi:hypothetical protein